mmetsp:Transcript_2460/g.2886  ORF Transcript_2460/g.2886 Transcript_2460/m.2886 type:complete len:94 (-) Transcript_2460:244-525(-)|eukprot:CAMPEP_0113846276 /NCGR_PEP_ID=MMETSP0372-20130328/1218_1 /TAXON_ID=340204 /ORGANISM="Lankesteria abbotti" /LENGTH=93 /DNA_ID=CAMNT_0000815403 /DNA_START=94 /DNA_END=375 /DNA_ORIENTATION=+ /assembly_acc=CAM_ASM_000359
MGKAKVEGERKKKVKKDGPKKAMSAYIFFSNKRRPEIVVDKPELKSKITEISKLIGEEWRGLDDTAKAPFFKEAEKDKQRYAKEMETHEKAKK